MAERELALISGRAHPELANALAAHLESPLVDAEVGDFPDDETKIKILEDRVRERDMFLIQPTGSPANHNIMEAYLMCDALRRASAARITLVAPYYGYGRQDRKEDSRVPISARAVVDMFEQVGVDRFMSIDLHSPQIQGFAHKPFDDMPASRYILEAIKDKVGNPVVVAPDISAGPKAQYYANHMDTQLAIIRKIRIDERTTEIAGIIGDSVKNRDVLLVDDVLATAGSMVKAANKVKEEGAEEVTVAVTHGVLCEDAIEKIEASDSIDRVYVTDTLPEVPGSTKIQRITIAPFLGNAILNVHNGESVSGLF